MWRSIMPEITLTTVAEEILALINSKPSTPTKIEIEAVLQGAFKALVLANLYPDAKHDHYDEPDKSWLERQQAAAQKRLDCQGEGQSVHYEYDGIRWRSVDYCSGSGGVHHWYRESIEDHVNKTMFRQERCSACGIVRRIYGA
jgi:hypothetical protein